MYQGVEVYPSGVQPIKWNHLDWFLFQKKKTREKQQRNIFLDIEPCFPLQTHSLEM